MYDNLRTMSGVDREYEFSTFNNMVRRRAKEREREKIFLPLSKFSLTLFAFSIFNVFNIPAR
jgi:hypothetical protein